MRRAKRVVLICRHCDDVFSRVKSDAKKSKGSFCSPRCQALYRHGFKFAVVACETCLQPFQKVATHVRRCAHHYCSRPCYHATVDRAALGRLGSAAPRSREPSPYVRFRRSQAGGLQRGRQLSKERLHEIAMLGVAARKAKGITAKPFSTPPSESRRLRIGLQFLGPLLTRVGK